MSGRKQHYIPQCLLKSFQTKRSGEYPQVLVFRKGEAPYPATKDVAAARYFYSDPSTDGSKTLDDRITDYENRLGPLLTQLRATPAGHGVSATVAAEVVAHLTIRGAYLRELFSLATQGLIAGTKTLFADGEAVRSLMGLDADEPTPILAELIDKVVSESKTRLPANFPMPLLRRMLLVLSKGRVQRVLR